jgi:hypothetical protein
MQKSCETVALVARTARPLVRGRLARATAECREAVAPGEWHEPDTGMSGHKCGSFVARAALSSRGRPIHANAEGRMQNAEKLRDAPLVARTARPLVRGGSPAPVSAAGVDIPL